MLVFKMGATQFWAFVVAVGMICIGICSCIFSIHDRKKDNTHAKMMPLISAARGFIPFSFKFEDKDGNELNMSEFLTKKGVSDNEKTNFIMAGFRSKRVPFLHHDFLSDEQATQVLNRQNISKLTTSQVGELTAKLLNYADIAKVKFFDEKGNEPVPTAPSLGDITNLLKVIIGIENPSFQVGVFLVVFAIIVIMLSFFMTY